MSLKGEVLRRNDDTGLGAGPAQHYAPYLISARKGELSCHVRLFELFLVAESGVLTSHVGIFSAGRTLTRSPGPK
jgi:hypothetical protein